MAKLQTLLEFPGSVFELRNFISKDESSLMLQLLKYEAGQKFEPHLDCGLWGGNATYQIDDINLDTGVVIKDIGTGICYTVANQGAIVGPLLTNYEEHSDCTACGG